MQDKIKATGRSSKEYTLGFLVSLGILITGMLLELITGGVGTGLPSWPVNVQLGLSFIIIIVFIRVYYRDLYAIKWLSGVPAAMSSIVLFTMLVLIMGLTSQNDPEASVWFRYTGLSHIRNSYPFLLSGLFLLTSLGLVILRRFKPLNLKNAGFLLNHLGLWIIVFAGSLGAGDLQRVTMRVNENETVWYGITDRHQIRDLPFTLKLINFSIEEYNPKLAYIRKHDLSFPSGINNNLRQIENGMKISIDYWDIEIKEFYMMSVKDSAGYIISEDTMSVPSAKLMARNTLSGNEINGWISCGNFFVSPEFLLLDDTYALAMTTPEPRTYSSQIEVVTRSGAVSLHNLQVNKPVDVEGWNLYQLSFDEKRGKWSELSVIEAIRDPWLKVIYAGIFMVLAGAVFMFWQGKN